MLICTALIGLVALYGRPTRARAYSDDQYWSFATVLLAVMFALSPVMNPWYALWLLPFAALGNARWPWVAATLVLLSYVVELNLGLISSNGPYHHPSWVRPVEYLGILMAVGFEWRMERNRRRQPVTPDPSKLIAQP